MTEAASETAPEVTVERTEGQTVTGKIKVWHLDKGYGFMTADDGGSDLFVHQSAISVAGERYRAVLPHTAVKCTFYVREGKDTAKDVTGVDGEPFPGFETKLEAAQKMAVADKVRPGMLTGVIKFMDKNKGFGFITPDAGGEEMFVHVGDIEGKQVLATGEPVAYTTKVKKGDREQAVEVVSTAPAAAAAPQPPAPYGYPPHYGGYPPQPPQYDPQYGYPAHPPHPYSSGPPASYGGMAHGTIKWYNEQKGFGFIVPAAGGTEVYFKGSDIVGGGSFTEGEAVTYEHKTGDGKAWAGSVTRSRIGKRKAPADDYASSYGAGYNKRPAPPTAYSQAIAPPSQHGYGAPGRQPPSQQGYGAPPPPHYGSQAPAQQGAGYGYGQEQQYGGGYGQEEQYGGYGHQAAAANGHQAYPTQHAPPPPRQSGYGHHEQQYY